MNPDLRRAITVVMVGLALWTLTVSCGTDERSPIAPTPLNRDSALGVASAGFGQLRATGVDLATCLREPVPACTSFAAVREPLRIGTLALSAPLNLTSTVAGTTVTLVWMAPAGTVTSYLIEAGSSSGLANLATLSTGNALTTFSTTGVPAGTYFVRVRAVDATGLGSASNEVMVVVGGGGCVPPGAPASLTTTTNSGGTVTFSWTAAPGTPTSYVLEAGSAPGLSNLANTDVGLTTTFTVTGVAAGTYYVRVRGRNACGVGPVSIELTLTVTLTVTTGGRQMTARIDGVPWTAIPAAIQVLRVNLPPPASTPIISVGGNDRFACPIILMTFAVPRVVGTYALGIGAPSGANASMNNSNCAFAGWQATSGSVTLATLTSTSASGTFAFILTPQSGTAATGTKVVTDGVFNVVF